MSAKSYLWLALSAYRQGDLQAVGNLVAAACESQDVAELEQMLAADIGENLMVTAATSLSAIASEITAGLEATAAEVDDGKFTLEDFSVETDPEVADDEGPDLLDQLIEEGTVVPQLDPDVGGVTYSASTVANAGAESAKIVSVVRSPVRLKD